MYNYFFCHYDINSNMMFSQYLMVEEISQYLMVEEIKFLRESHNLIQVAGNFLTCLSRIERGRESGINERHSDHSAIGAGPKK